MARNNHVDYAGHCALYLFCSKSNSFSKRKVKNNKNKSVFYTKMANNIEKSKKCAIILCG